jgi:hypothetical protein
MFENPNAGITYNDTEEQALSKYGKSPSPESESKEFTTVKQIVAKHPGEWGNAAKEIDATLGAGTATKYDDYLKGNYSGKKSALLTQDKLNKLAVYGITSEMADWIAEQYAAGNSDSEIANALGEGGTELISNYKNVTLFGY